jgi:regulator of PEP synthase PpsR (kinase-PPPase family)
VGEQSYEQSFEIIMDPRVEAEGLTNSDIEIQIEMINKVTDLLSDARKLQDDLEKEAKSLKDKKAKDKLERLEKVNAILSQLKNDDGAYPKQMLVSQISYLLNILDGADKLPGQEEKDRYHELYLQLSEVKESLKD